MQKIHYQADFTFVLDLTDKAGRPMPFPSNDFRILVETTGNVVYSAGQTGGKPFNCSNEGGKIKVVVDNPGFAPGTLSITYTEHVPDASYPDGMNTITFRKVLDIALVTTGYDVPTDLSAALQLPAIRFRYEDFTAEQLATLMKPATDAANAANAKMEDFARAEGFRNTNEKLRVDAETLRARDFQTAQRQREVDFLAAQDARAKAFGTAQNDRATQFDQAQTARVTAFNDAEKGRQTLFTNKETARQSAFDKAETARATAETARVKAETARADAETKRETDFGTAKAAAETATAGAVKAEKEATAATAECRKLMDSFLPTVEENFWYGVEIELSNRLTTLTRIGNPKLHRTLPLHCGMRGCLLDDNGNVSEYLPKESWVNAPRDGSKGQVMVEIPEHYESFKREGTKLVVRFSMSPLAGFLRVPKMYIGAYQATWQRSTKMLCSVVNMDPDFRGGNPGASGLDGTVKSSLGRPVCFFSRTGFREAARRRGGVGWNCYLYTAHRTLYWLYLVEYANTDCQLPFNAELTPEGYRQGGLGNGCTQWDWNEWQKHRGITAFVPCGHTDSLGNGTGVVPFDIVDETGAVVHTAEINRYRGVELPFGHIWQWLDGVNLIVSPEVADGGDGRSKMYVCNNPALISDTGVEGYDYVGDIKRNSGWMTEPLFGDAGEMLPANTGGASSMSFCDYYATSVPKQEELRGVLVGGNADDSANAGLAYSYAQHVPSNTNATFGSRLCFIHETTNAKP